MSLPKEPRQKMINMMYLVLTALLALNVSVEVLNAFKTVNNSIIKSNTVIDQKNQMTYDAFIEDLKDSKTMAKAQIWAPHAQQVQKLSAALSANIEQLKQRLIEESSPKKNAEGKVTEFADGNLDAATRVMDKNGEGPKLYAQLKQFRNDLLAELDPAKYPNEGQKVLDELKNQQATFERNLPLDTHIPPSESGNKDFGSDSAHNWTIRYFHMTPTIAALTILSKFQSDVKNSESQVVDYLFKQIGEVKVVFDQFKPLISPSATYLMPGDELSVKAGIGAFSAAAKPKIFMNGTEYPVNGDGTAEMKYKVSSTGNVHVKIEYTKPDGTVGVSENDVKYTVGQPSGASVFLEKMNVLYVAEENPLKISGGSVGREKVHVSFSNGEIHHGDGDEWVAVPKTPGMGKIIVDADGKHTEFEMRIKYLPNPTGFVGTKNGGSMSSAEFKANGGLRAVLDNSEFISPFRVVGYKLAAIGGNISQYTEASNEGPRWSGQAASIVSRATPGTNIFFDDIRVMGKDGRVRQLPPMVFNLK